MGCPRGPKRVPKRVQNDQPTHIIFGYLFGGLEKMNRTLVFGIAIFLAVVGIAMIGGEKQAIAGHGCSCDCSDDCSACDNDCSQVHSNVDDGVDYCLLSCFLHA